MGAQMIIAVSPGPRDREGRRGEAGREQGININ